MNRQRAQNRLAACQMVTHDMQYELQRDTVYDDDGELDLKSANRSLEATQIAVEKLAGILEETIRELEESR